MSEWSVDYNVPGGADKEGWQYAADFPTYVTAVSQNVVSKTNQHFKNDIRAMHLTYPLTFSYRTFHGHKTMKDFVRRRRWIR